ncbi:MAG: hypothetical protein U1F68_00755 [Gammaproteobacteria bacterium]
MDALYHFVIHDIFRPALRGDPDLVQAILESAGEIYFKENDLLFTLPALFDFVMPRWQESSGACVPLDEGDYKAFRRMFYRNPTNTALREIGGIVVIARAEKDHERSLYRLTRLAT